MSKLIENQQIKNFVEEVDTELVQNNDILLTHCLLDTNPKHRMLCLLKDEYPIVFSESIKLIHDTLYLICCLTKRPRAEPDAENAVDTLKLIGDLADAIAHKLFLTVDMEDSELFEMAIRPWIEKYKDNNNEWLQRYIKSIEAHIQQVRSHKISVIQKMSK